MMKIGTAIRAHRLQKGLSQGDIEKKTGLLRCYLSRVENGHTVPSLDTLSKIAWPSICPSRSSSPTTPWASRPTCKSSPTRSCAF
jgi:DNA-binding XRE family transcriptional regulator